MGKFESFLLKGRCSIRGRGGDGDKRKGDNSRSRVPSVDAEIWPIRLDIVFYTKRHGMRILKSYTIAELAYAPEREPAIVLHGAHYHIQLEEVASGILLSSSVGNDLRLSPDGQALFVAPIARNVWGDPKTAPFDPTAAGFNHVSQDGDDIYHFNDQDQYAILLRKTETTWRVQLTRSKEAAKGQQRLIVFHIPADCTHTTAVDVLAANGWVDPTGTAAV